MRATARPPDGASLARRPVREPGITVRGVRRVVAGRQRQGTGRRVTYEDDDGEWIAEKIVLKRCRRAGYGAHRLPPWIWRAMARLIELEVAAPEASLERLLKALPAEGFVRAPRAVLVRDLRGAVSSRRLRALIERHNGPAIDPTKPGVPDLFVFRRGPGVRLCAAKFVEVKRPKERVKPHQLAELNFMISLGLKAGVLRLIEAGA